MTQRATLAPRTDDLDELIEDMLAHDDLEDNFTQLDRPHYERGVVIDCGRRTRRAPRLDELDRSGL